MLHPNQTWQKMQDTNCVLNTVKQMLKSAPLVTELHQHEIHFPRLLNQHQQLTSSKIYSTETQNC